MRLPSSRTRGGRLGLVAGLALTALALATGQAGAAALDCGAVQTILASCLGSDGGAELGDCQPEVDLLALRAGPGLDDRRAVCVCVHQVEENVLHYFPNRDIATLNHRLKAVGLYAWDCGILC